MDRKDKKRIDYKKLAKGEGEVVKNEDSPVACLSPVRASKEVDDLDVFGEEGENGSLDEASSEEDEELIQLRKEMLEAKKEEAVARREKEKEELRRQIKASKENVKRMKDTERLYTEATQNVCDIYGKKYTWDLKKQIMGMKEMVSAKKIVESLELPISVEEYLTRIHKEYDRLFPTVPLLPGADKLVRHLHKHQVPIAVVTGSNAHSFELKTVNHKEFFALFHHQVLCGDDPEVKHGKPHPDAFIVGAQRFNCPDLQPSNVLVFEDAMNGVEAAHAAGMPCVWVPHAEQDKTVLEGKTELIIDSLEEFQPEMFGLPPFDS